jgi:hypothetical protein
MFLICRKIIVTIHLKFKPQRRGDAKHAKIYKYFLVITSEAK